MANKKLKKLTIGDSFDARTASVGFVYQAFVTAIREGPPNPSTVFCPEGTVQKISRWIDLESATLCRLHIEEHAAFGWVYVVDADGFASDGRQYWYGFAVTLNSSVPKKRDT